MGIILSLSFIPVFNRMVKLHQEINGKWITFLYTLTQLLHRRKQNKTNRVMIHNVWKDSLRDGGIMPFPHEWEYDCPNQIKSEDLLIYGVNSSKQSIKIEIKWRVSNDIKNRSAVISMRFDDNDGNYYTLEEESKVEFKKKVYKMSGLTIEILAPFKRKTIKFRGYLTKNGQKLVFVKFRFIWSALSRVYDFTHDFDDHFISKEWTNTQKIQTEQQFEDRFEQLGQFKGTFVEEDRPQRVLYFWGSFGKKYLESKPINRRIIRIVGFNKKGIGFDLGFLSNNKGFEYRFGFLFEKSNGFKKLTKTTLKKNDFNDLLVNPNISFKALFGEKEYEFKIKENTKSLANDLIVNGSEGMCYIFEEKETQFQEPIKTIQKPLKDSSLVLGLNEENAKSVEQTGGKGSSLAVLMSLSQQLTEENYENNFSVGNGVVVTTNAYQRLLEEYKDIEKAIQELEKATDLPKNELKYKCHNLENLISNHKLPQIIAEEIEKKLKQNFNDFETKLFAVRSSGASEDSEEMSAAGQMTTYLGVKGVDEINQSVMKCWSSQFSHIAFEYKRGYGQPINSPMAVVIQEMIGCESAGVMFTCDPISGDERIIEITGNYGLGESVVSASSEPDTIRMTVNIESNSLSKRRTIKGIASKIIGAKKMSIKLLEKGGTIEEEVLDKEKCCLSDEDLYRLADIGLKIQKHYGNVRDIEWGLKGGQIFMLQSRPVTNLDQTFSEYEVMHEMDSPHPTEFEIYSRTHWGEILPGSSSWTVFSFTWGNKSRQYRSGIKQGRLTTEDYNPYTTGNAVQYNQLMTNMTNLGQWSDYPHTKESVHKVLSYFGHHIEDEDILNLFKEIKKKRKKPSIFQKIKNNYNMYYDLIFGPKKLIKHKTLYVDHLKYNSVDNINARKPNNSRDMLNAISDENARIGSVQGRNHPVVSNGCHMKNLFLRNVLEGAQKNNSHLEEDYHLLISSCEDVISAEVPNTLRDIAISIKDKTQFTQLSDGEALKLLREGSDSASQKFEQFLKRHGHRGYREFDPMCLPWGDDPIPCVKTIKAILSGNESKLIPKVVKTVDEVIDEIKTPLSFSRKLLIRKVLLPWSRAGIGYRELSKHFMIWMFNQRRQALRLLAKSMVTEGLIPEVETYFYLTSEEVDQLIDGERDPIINMRARLRRRYLPKMCRYKFDEFIKGPEMKPRNFDEQIIAPKLTTHSIQLKGTPVSIGSVKARVCVAEDITEADNIESGDILITYSTDIGWSPYFPLISGIVTEIGGTASHGVVIAREYGIPSLIAVENACRLFKTGDICVLDTPSATITKVS